MSKRLVRIYKGSLKNEAYLYVDMNNDLTDVPELLLSQFGERQEVMTLMLDPGRKLARVDAAEVLAKIEQQGYYLQMPPTAAELLNRDGSGG